MLCRTTHRYQGITKDVIPTVNIMAAPPADSASQATCTEETRQGFVRIIAGSYGGVDGPAKTWTPVNMLEVQLDTPDIQYELTLYVSNASPCTGVLHAFACTTPPGSGGAGAHSVGHIIGSLQRQWLWQPRSTRSCRSAERHTRRRAVPIHSSAAVNGVVGCNWVASGLQVARFKVQTCTLMTHRALLSL